MAPFFSRLLSLFLASSMVCATPALALDWGHSTDEPLTDMVKDAGLKMSDKQFQNWLTGLNRANLGKPVRRTGWVVDSYSHVSMRDVATVLVSNRVDRGGVTWTLYLPGHVGLSLRPGDQVEWEGRIAKIEPSGEVRLRAEHVVKRIPQGSQLPEAWAAWPYMRYDNAPWWKYTLAERPLVRRVDPVLPPRALQDGVAANPVVRVWVSPPGHVARAEIARSSGREDVDAAVIDAVRHWRYQPFPAGRAEDQLGEITIPVRAF